MPTMNPGRGKLKPHLRKTRSGIWVRFFRDRDGRQFGVAQVSWMTAHSKDAVEAAVWCAILNARTLANQGPWNCRSVLPHA